MNLSVNRENFNTLGEREIANFIEQAKDLIILAIPSMTNIIADSLLNSHVNNLQIIISNLANARNKKSETASHQFKLSFSNDIFSNSVTVSRKFMLNVWDNILSRRGTK